MTRSLTSILETFMAIDAGLSKSRGLSRNTTLRSAPRPNSPIRTASLDSFITGKETFGEPSSSSRLT